MKMLRFLGVYFILIGIVKLIVYLVKSRAEEMR